MDLYVGNLSKLAMDRDLVKLFEQFGIVVSARVVTDNYTRRSRGFAFVTMETHASGEKAILKLDKTVFMSQAIAVRESTPTESIGLQDFARKK
jgi:RNA recognition motif-containing protein